MTKISLVGYLGRKPIAKHELLLEDKVDELSCSGRRGRDDADCQCAAFDALCLVRDQYFFIDELHNVPSTASVSTLYVNRRPGF